MNGLDAVHEFRYTNGDIQANLGIYLGTHTTVPLFNISPFSSLHVETLHPGTVLRQVTWPCVHLLLLASIFGTWAMGSSHQSSSSLRCRSVGRRSCSRIAWRAIGPAKRPARGD
jgi:hypothetical protein